MFGGLQGAGADDAWYSTSLEVEHALLHNLPLVGASADLYKCCDQIIRSLLHAILACAGLPTQILTAYVNFMESTLIHNSIGDSYGLGHKHRCGIPQGCPLSMVFVSILLRPWMLQMEELGAIPRTLAEDIMLLAKGSRALHIIKAAFE